MSFKWNPDGVRRLGDEIERKIDDAVGPVASECAGQSVESIIPRVRAALVSAGVEPNEHGVREIAERISRPA
jgi:hypothetical protein